MNNKYREIVLYLIFGVLTTVVGYGAYVMLTRVFLYSTMTSNALSFLVAVLFAYLTNRHYVFASKRTGMQDRLKEFIEFLTARLFGFCLDMVLMLALVEMMALDDLMVKAFVNVSVIVVNYSVSKYYIFNPKRIKA